MATNTSTAPDGAEHPVLIVDDSPADRFLYERLLNANGDRFSVVKAETPIIGLELASKLTPACILLDYRMPELNGIAFIKELDRRNIQSSVVMLTGESDAEISAEAFKVGAADYLIKGRVTVEILKDTVQRAISNYFERLSGPSPARPVPQSQAKGALVAKIPPNAPDGAKTGALQTSNEPSYLPDQQNKAAESVSSAPVKAAEARTSSDLANKTVEPEMDEIEIADSASVDTFIENLTADDVRDGGSEIFEDPATEPLSEERIEEVAAMLEAEDRKEEADTQTEAADRDESDPVIDLASPESLHTPPEPENKVVQFIRPRPAVSPLESVIGPIEEPFAEAPEKAAVVDVSDTRPDDGLITEHATDQALSDELDSPAGSTEPPVQEAAGDSLQSLPDAEPPAVDSPADNVAAEARVDESTARLETPPLGAQISDTAPVEAAPESAADSAVEAVEVSEQPPAPLDQVPAPIDEAVDIETTATLATPRPSGEEPERAAPEPELAAPEPDPEPELVVAKPETEREQEPAAPEPEAELAAPESEPERVAPQPVSADQLEVTEPITAELKSQLLNDPALKPAAPAPQQQTVNASRSAAGVPDRPPAATPQPVSDAENAPDGFSFMPEEQPIELEPIPESIIADLELDDGVNLDDTISDASFGFSASNDDGEIGFNFAAAVEIADSFDSRDAAASGPVLLSANVAERPGAVRPRAEPQTRRKPVEPQIKAAVSEPSVDAMADAEANDILRSMQLGDAPAPGAEDSPGSQYASDEVVAAGQALVPALRPLIFEYGLRAEHGFVLEPEGVNTPLDVAVLSRRDGRRIVTITLEYGTNADAIERRRLNFRRWSLASKFRRGAMLQIFLGGSHRARGMQNSPALDYSNRCSDADRGYAYDFLVVEEKLESTDALVGKLVDDWEFAARLQSLIESVYAPS